MKNNLHLLREYFDFKINFKAKVFINFLLGRRNKKNTIHKPSNELNGRGNKRNNKTKTGNFQRYIILS